MSAATEADLDQNPDLKRAVGQRLRPDIQPRSAWGDALPPTGELTAEDDVRFLLVHHTASTNDYGPDEVADEIRGFYKFHIGPERGWPDVAYNFLIDRFGGIWEAREGSIDGPVRGDATGGSQGFALLTALIGNHGEEPPTPEALAALQQLLAWLGHRYRVDTAPGATATFRSRGSNRWPEGNEVTTRTISGHRDMSETTCPGDFVYELLDQTMPEQVEALRRVAVTDAVAAAEVDVPTSTPERTTEVTIGSEAVAVGTDGVEPAETAAPVVDDGGDDLDRYLIPGGAAMVVGGVAGLIALRRRRVGG